MKHDINTYSEAMTLVEKIDTQMSENLISRMDSEFDAALEEPDHKKRSKLVKAHHRNVKEVEPVSSVIYPLQIRMTQIKTNVSFILENACYNLSYHALTRYFAEYDFLSQQIKKDAKKVKNDVLADFINEKTVLDENYFQILMDTITVMKENIVYRMTHYPTDYVDLDIDKDSEIVFDDFKHAYKSHIKGLKEELKKQRQV